MIRDAQCIYQRAAAAAGDTGGQQQPADEQQQLQNLKDSNQDESGQVFFSTASPYTSLSLQLINNHK